MTPIEKSWELYTLFWRETPQPYIETIGESEMFPDLKFHDWDKNWTNRMAIGSALICVDEIIELMSGEFHVKLCESNGIIIGEGLTKKYWEEVREELIKRKNK